MRGKVPFAFTQSALMLRYALRSRASSTERSLTSSTFTIEPLRARARIGGGMGESFGGNGRLIR